MDILLSKGKKKTESFMHVKEPFTEDHFLNLTEISDREVESFTKGILMSVL